MKKECKCCHEEFESNDKRVKYCSRECRDKYYKEKYQKKEETKLPKRKCKKCNKTFQPNHKMHFFCCNECRNDFLKDIHGRCEVCGRLITKSKKAVIDGHVTCGRRKCRGQFTKKRRKTDTKKYKKEIHELFGI